MKHMDRPSFSPPDISAGPGSTAAPGQDAADGDAVFHIRRPAVQTLPLVLASPHSGRNYPMEFLASSRLDALSLRRSEDCFVDEIFAPAADLGAPLISALFPRAYLDPNREPFELDPAMFDGPVPSYVNSRSARVQAGLGTIARIVASGENIYAGKLRFRDALRRVERCYFPYHAALRGLIEETQAQFGYCILLDCHSMPSIGLPPEIAAGGKLDMVLGDCYGSSCVPAVITAAEMVLRTQGYGVGRNAPYAGGHTTRHYGRTADGVHALQIEINRALYMEERTLERRPFISSLAQHMAELVTALGRLQASALLPTRR